MSEIKIEKLTPEQEALIPVYREKWRAIALSTEPINSEKASTSIKAAYQLIGYLEPEIIFCDSPFAARKTFGSQPGHQLASRLTSQLESLLWSQMLSRVEDGLWSELTNYLSSQLERQLWNQVWRQLENQLANHQFNLISISPEVWACAGSLYDFCIAVLNCAYLPREWQIFQSLVGDCGWILPYEKICYVCDRPRDLSFDDRQRLHAEGSPAIQFADGFSVYAYHGVRLPEKYGQFHPHQWQPEWLLEEDNAELRRVLIQGIGYARICQQLQVEELDSWQEYTLLKIGNDVDVEPIHLLKMTCPSTGFIHALRVPPDLTSARKAIAWVNWGIDPDKFSVQT